MACLNQFTSESETYIHPPPLYDVPPYLCDPEDTSQYTDIGTRVMESMLLTQYTNSVNLQEYIGAFVKEMDFLLYQTKKVELERYIQNAQGAQLDVIGVILQQSRNIHIPSLWFGFQGASPVAGMADEATPTNGGIFISESQEQFELKPLDDISYRRVLLCRGFCINQTVFSVDVIYEAVSILLGFVPSSMSITQVSPKSWQLELDSSNITSDQATLILAVAHWFIPMTYGFNVVLV